MCGVSQREREGTHEESKNGDFMRCYVKKLTLDPGGGGVIEM